MPEKAKQLAEDYFGFGSMATHFHWKEFISYCDDEGISMENPDDYMPWWRCWLTGAEAETTRG